jgi:hypothetical protein
MPRAPNAYVPPDDEEVNPAMSFSYNPTVTDETLVQVAKRTTLKRLYLTGTKITDAGLGHLAPLEQLKDLHLAETAVTDAGLVPLEGIKSLQKLDLRRTQVTAAGVERLKAAIPGLKVVQ